MSSSMPSSPFPPDPIRGARLAQLLATRGEAFPAALAEAMVGEQQDPRHPAAAVPAAVVAQLVTAFDLEGVEEAAILSIVPARALARPTVSGYHVGAVALVPEGDLLLGGNLEFPGASIWQTVHAEGFVTLLARARATHVTVLATGQARPCAHCRQVLAEMDAADRLVLVDPPGRRLVLHDIYPWPFAPSDLGVRGAVPAGEAFPFLGLDGDDTPAGVAVALVAAGRRAHAPYSGSPAACILRTADGLHVPGTVLESVAFNPTIGPVQDALVSLLAAGRTLGEITDAWVSVGRADPVGHASMARDALTAATPGASIHVRYWQ